MKNVLRFIYEQKLVSHNNIKNTEIYTHISSQGIGRIKRPLDFGIINKVILLF